MFEHIRNAAISVASNIFETMFFTFLEVEEDNNRSTDFKPSSVFLRGEIEFEGKHTGRLILYLPVELAQTMASNFMGLEEEKASESQAVDVVNELCNMICGNLFSMLDRKTVWNLTIPRTQQVSTQKMDNDMNTSGIMIHFDAGGHPVQLNLQLNHEGI